MKVDAQPHSTAATDALSGRESRRGAMMALIAAFLGWMFDGMEMGIFPIVARPALQAMQAAHHIPDENFVQTWMGIITALFLLGAALGGVVFGWLGDRIGRVRAMTWSILAYSLFTGLCYFAREPIHLGLLRFTAALGMGGEWALGVALVMETWPGRFRPLMAAFIGAAANLGYCLIALIAIRFPVTNDSWRWVMMVGAAPALLTFFIRLFVPESKRWQASVQRGATNPLREIFAPPLLRNTLLAIGFASIALIVTWGIVQWIPLWADQISADRIKAEQRQLVDAFHTYAPQPQEGSPLARAKSEVTAVMEKLSRNDAKGALPHIDAAVTQLAQSGGDPKLTAGTAALLERQFRIREQVSAQPTIKAYIQLVSAFGAVMGCLIAPLVGGWLGRRPVYFGLCLASLIVCSVLFRGFTAYSTGFLVMVGLVGMTTAAFYGWLPLYLPELFPTRVRATGQGLAFNFGRILAAIGAWQMGPLMAWFDKSYAQAGATIVLIYIVGMAIIWLAPETKGRPLPE